MSKTAVTSEGLKRFGDNIRRLRTEAGLTLEGLSKAAAISQAYLAFWEAGTRCGSELPTEADVGRLALALRIDPADLLDGVATPETPTRSAEADKYPPPSISGPVPWNRGPWKVKYHNNLPLVCATDYNGKPVICPCGGEKCRPQNAVIARLVEWSPVMADYIIGAAKPVLEDAVQTAPTGDVKDELAAELHFINALLAYIAHGDPVKDRLEKAYAAFTSMVSGEGK